MVMVEGEEVCVRVGEKEQLDDGWRERRWRTAKGDPLKMPTAPNLLLNLKCQLRSIMILDMIVKITSSDGI